MYTRAMPKALQGKEPVEVGIRDLRAHLSRWLREVRSGREVVVTDRGEPIARLVPQNREGDLIDHLIAEGLVSPPHAAKRPVDRDRLVKPRRSVTEVLLMMRDGTWT